MISYKRGSRELEALLYRFNPWWEGDSERPFRELIPRDRYLKVLLEYLKGKDILILTGLRRIGKTSIMKLLIKELLKEVEPRKILYVSLDHYLLSGLSILEIVEEYMTILKISADERAYLFLDEVVEKEKFDLQLKNLYDLYDFRVVVSASSSIMLRELPYLIGRSRLLEIFPLSFKEYLNFKGVSLRRRDSHLIRRYFEDYLKDGGLPEYVLRGDIEYHNSLLNDIIYRDIIVKERFRDEVLVKDFSLLLLERVGKRLSVNKVARILSVSPDTVRRLLSAFQRTYLFFPLKRCGRTTERVRSPVKVYIADIGLRNFTLGFRDKGALFENLVYHRLRERYRDDICYVYQSGIELDFLAGGELLVEVKYDGELPDKQRKLFEEMKVKEKLLISSLEDYLIYFEEL